MFRGKLFLEIYPNPKRLVKNIKINLKIYNLNQLKLSYTLFVKCFQFGRVKMKYCVINLNNEPCDIFGIS